MLHIAICDDNPEQLSAITTLINDYLAFNNLEAQVQTFGNPDSLLVSCETERFHIYILDIVMPMMSGIELGKEIRHLDREAQIIFATTEPSFAIESFSSNPINYLIKPVDKMQLFVTLDLALTKIDFEEENIVTLRTKEGLRVIKLSSIICCEYLKHTVKYTLMGGEILTTISIKESFSEHIEYLLSDVRFIQPYISYVVNMSRVEAFSKDGFVMRGGIIIPISAKQYPIVRDAFMDYLLAKGVCK